MKKRAFLAGPLALLAGAVSGADDTSSDTAALRYGGDAAFAPFESLDAQGQPRGFQIDLLAELALLLRLKIHITLKPWAETEADFRAGRLDVVAMVDTAPRREWALFTHGHATPALALYFRRGRPEPQGLQGLAGLRVAVPDGEPMRDTLARWLSGLPGPFVRRDGALQTLLAVQQGQADVALLPRAYAEPVLAVGTTPDVTTSRLNLDLQTYAMAVAPGRDALRVQLQGGLDELERNGRLEALRTQWLSSHRDVAQTAKLSQGLTHQVALTWGLGLGSTAAVGWLGVGLWRRGQRIAAERARRLGAEGALQRAEDLLARTFAQSPEPMLILQQDGNVVRDANAALLALLGVGAEQLIGQPLAALSRHVEPDALQPLRESLDSQGALDAAPLRLTRADGSVRDCLISADRLDIDGAAHLFCNVRDITEQLQHDAALRHAYDDLARQLAQVRHEAEQARAGQARAEGALQEFTRSVSHDLRGPLHAVQGFAGLLRQRLQAGHLQEAATFTEHIERAASRMNAMIGALSRLAQVARHPLQRREVDMQKLAQDTWTLIAASHPQRQVEMRIEALPAAQADPDLVAQVWQNLLDNASKYSARTAAPKVRVDSHRDRGTWYRITDNGAGFDMAKARLLFQPFQRLHRSDEFEGTGVGLSLVKRIIDHHGGDIRVRSAPGVGTVAEFTLDPTPQA